jgi:hypothetical protein
MSKAGYESIPDAEAPAAASYDDLGDDQAALLQDLDAAMALAKLDFSLTDVKADEVASSGGPSLLSSMLPPILMAVGAAGGAWLLHTEAPGVAAAALPFSPYLIAFLFFSATVTPLVGRLEAAVAPLFVQSEKLQDKVSSQVGGIATTVDTTVDALQAKVGLCLKPLAPTMEKASRQAAPLKKIDPTLEIPDTKDIDDEFDGLQGQVSDKVQAAQDHLDISAYIPSPLKSAKHFYWQVIVPVLVIALVLQGGVAWVVDTAAPTEPVTAPSRYLRGKSAAAVEADVSSSSDYEFRQLSATVFSEEPATPADEESLSSVFVVVGACFAMAVLQLTLLFGSTSGPVKAWMVNRTQTKVADRATVTLREYGVSTALEDVMGTRLARIRTKLLKLFSSVGKLQAVLDKIPDIPGLGKAQNALGSVMGGSKRGSFLGKMFK